MIQATIARLTYVLDTLPPILRAIPDDEFTHKPAPGKWSKKEELGHLIDSAANNHQRFVRIPHEHHPLPGYTQDEWVKHNYYQNAQPGNLVQLWEAYNRHLLFIISHIPEAELSRTAIVKGSPVTLGFLIDDYLHHMEHHLHRIADYQ